MIIIGIVGGKGAGKTTATEYLRSYYGAEDIALAEPIKQFLLQLGLTLEQLYGTQAQKETLDPRFGLSPRALMQRIGDAFAEVFGQDFLSRQLIERLDKMTGLVVVSDVRRRHEAEALRERGAILWRLNYAPGLRRADEVRHISESDWQSIDVDLEITPAEVGAKELGMCVDEASKLFDIKPFNGD